MSWPLLLIIILGASLPPLWMRRLQRRDRLISPRLFWFGVIAHVIMCIAGLLVYLPGLVAYCGILLCLIGLSHFPPLQSETHQRLRQAEKDIATLLYKLEKTPEHSARHYALAEAYCNNRQYDEAIAEFQLALQLDPGLARAVKGKIKNARLAKAEHQQRWGISTSPVPNEEQQP